MDNLWNLMAGGAALGIIAATWSKIKGLIWRVASLFVQQVEISSEFAHNALVAYLVANYRRSGIYDRMYGAWNEHQRDGRYGLVCYEIFGSRTLLLWQGWRPFWFSNAVEKKARSAANKEGGGENSAIKVFSTLTYLRGALDVEAMLKAACRDCNAQAWSCDDEEKKRNRFVIHFMPKRESDHEEWGHSSNGLPWYQQGMYRLLSHHPEQLGKAPLHAGQALENLIFPGRVKQLIKEIELWRNSRDWYRAKGIPWKRGWLLYGPPGTGKTALARAFAEDLNLPMYVFNLAQMSNSDLLKAWKEMQVNVPCVALIEDVDNVFHGRENIARKNGMIPILVSPPKKEGETDGNHQPFTPLTFDCLLNCLDGVERSDGIFTIITTNDIAKVDPALGQPRRLSDGTVEFISTRPGRIDKAIELTYMEAADKKRMAQRILADYPPQYREVMKFIDQYPDLRETPAQFQERCGQIALQCFWRDQLASEIREAATRRYSGAEREENPEQGGHVRAPLRVAATQQEFV